MLKSETNDKSIDNLFDNFKVLEYNYYDKVINILIEANSINEVKLLQNKLIIGASDRFRFGFKSRHETTNYCVTAILPNDEYYKFYEQV